MWSASAPRETHTFSKTGSCRHRQQHHQQQRKVIIMKDKFLDFFNNLFDWLLGKDAVLVDADFDAKKKDNTPRSQPKTFVIIILIVTALTGVCLLAWAGVNMVQAATTPPVAAPLVKVRTAT